MKNAIVLSGGSVKGCFQVGAFKAIIESGFIPDTIYGTSVGSLNGAFIANEAAQTFKNNGQTPLTLNDWLNIAKALENYWLSNIRKPYDVAMQRSKVGDIIHIAFNTFDGLSDTEPINDKIDDILGGSNFTDLQLFANKTQFNVVVASVDFVTSEITFKSPSDMNFIGYVKGSMAIPVAMPPSLLNNMVLFDGGTRAVAPYGQAINDGAANIIGVMCQSDELDPASGFDAKNLMDLVERTQDIIVNQNVKNDKKFIDIINGILNEVKLKGYTLNALSNYKLISHKSIQPDTQLLIDITDFNSTDISNGILQGYNIAKRELAGATWL